jgi:catecholate siderophore receptor
MIARTVSALALACSLAAPALAADAAADAAATAAADAGALEAAALDDQGEVGTIVVTGTRDRYSPDETSTATRTPTPLNDIPQAISIVTERQIEDQALFSIADVLRSVPGATIGQGEGHRDQVTIRGNNSTADFFTDGVRDDVQYYRGLYNVERVEVLKGPNAMIFGRGGGGGVINRVLKRPAADELIAASLSANSFDALYGDLDVNQPLGEVAAARLNATVERFRSHRDAYEGERFAVNPAVAFSFGGRTRIDLSYEYAEDDRVVDRGVPSENGRPLRGFRDAFFGARGLNDMDFSAHILRGTAEHRFSDALHVTSRLLYGDYDKAYQNAFAATAVTTNSAGVRQVGIEAYRDPTRRKNLFSQTDLVWEGRTGGLGHVLLAGVEYGDQDTANQRINGFFDSGVPTTSSGRRTLVPLADPVAIPPVAFRPGPGNRSVETKAEVLAFYLQDQVSIGDNVDVIAGIRHDRFELAVDDLLAKRSFARTDNLWSPRLGLVLKPSEPLSLYLSYSRSYLPQSGDQFLSLDATAETLEPERFDNVEAGLKWTLLQSLDLTAAVYRLDRSNTRAPGTVPGTVVQTGKQRSRGIELSLAGEITPNWRLHAGYALQEAEIRSTTSAAPAGRDVPQVPRHQASLWTRYDLSRAFGLGFGAWHQSRSFASISNAVALPAFTRLDAAAFFRLGAGIEAQVNVENLLGHSYFPTAHNDNNITTGAPRNIRGTLRLRF